RSQRLGPGRPGCARRGARARRWGPRGGRCCGQPWGCLSFFAVGELFPLAEQVEQPLQLGGAGVQVCGELGAGLCRAAVQRVKQLAVVVCGAAEFAAGGGGQRPGEALLLLELPVEAAQPGAAGGRDQGGVEEPVTVEHGGGVAAVEGVFYLPDQVCQVLVDRRVPVAGEGVHCGQLQGGAGSVDVCGIRPGDVRDDDAAVHLVADQALAGEDPCGFAEGAAGDAEFGGQGGFAQRGARQQPTGQDGPPDGIGGLVGG